MPRACERAAGGRLIAQGTACWRACAERREARKARIERLFVGREKNLCELTRAHASGDDKDDRRLCRFSDAGNDELSTRSGGRRPKSAKARNRGRYARSAVP